MGRGGAPVGKEVERERVRAGIADDLPSEPKDVLSPGLTPLLASSARVCATPLAAGLAPQSAPGRNRFPSSASSRPLRSTPSTSLPPSGPHSRASTGGGVFLGTTCMRLHTGPQALGAATDPPPRTAPGSRLPAPGSRPAGLSQPSRLRPGWPPGALLSGVAYKGRLPWPRARKASVARFFPHPHEILGLTPPCRRPWASGRVGQRPTTRAEVPLNAPGERVGERRARSLFKRGPASGLLGSKRLFQGSALSKGRSKEETKRCRGPELFMASAAQPSCCFKRAIKMNYD
ncbi:uncharacterized protein LOC100683344 isoform X1 [Canis lupus familiaris]|uniref:uncharacterized protein LOC100683344 isoform X1 n=1 Tax=Canis lupus familiaris TaxID=9615 RepID=UPI000BAA18DC|nr:uncharacterized protein LOC100683344 isoform X1 [Canis lupus familiaris]|eukprot:XP_022283218.1 uncharacterized protein LOC100683344 [Canis lupus familiaris]